MKNKILILELYKPNKNNRIYTRENFEPFLEDFVYIVDNPMELEGELPIEKIIGSANIFIIDNKLYAEVINLREEFEYQLNERYNLCTFGLGEIEYNKEGNEVVVDYWLNGLYFQK